MPKKDFTTPLSLNGLYPNLDDRYTNNGDPYVSKNAAETALASKLNAYHIGLTVLVKESGWTEAKEYWVQPKGTTPETYGLVDKGGEDLTKALTLSGEQKHNASANINNRAAVVADVTGEVQALGYKVLNAALSFAEQVESTQSVDNSNMIFEIKDEFDLDGDSVVIPTNSTLKFNGGRLVNGNIQGNQTKFDGNPRFINISFEGTFDLKEISPLWFGAFSQPEMHYDAPNLTMAKYNAATDQSIFFSKAATLVPLSNGVYKIPEGVFVFKAPIVWPSSTNFNICGDYEKSVLVYGKPIDVNQVSPILFKFNGGGSGYIKDFRVGSLSALYYNGVFSKGIVFDGLYLDRGIVENINVYRSGIFLRGQIHSCSIIRQCSVVGLGYAFLTRSNESNYDSDDGTSGISQDSEISGNFISATNAFDTQQTKNRCVFQGSMVATRITNNFFDYFKYIFWGASISNSKENIIANNTFDLIFSFIKKPIPLKNFTITNNTFAHCSWSAASDGSWGSYSTDEDVRNKRWVIFDNLQPTETIIANNNFTECDKIIRLSATPNTYGLIYDGDYDTILPPKSKIYSKNSVGEFDINIGGRILFNNYTGSSSAQPRKWYREIKSTTPYTVSADKSTCYFQWREDNVYPLRMDCYDAGELRGNDIKKELVNDGCFTYKGRKIIKKSFTVNSVTKDYIVAYDSTYPEKCYGCFSKDFNELKGFFSTSAGYEGEIFDLEIKITGSGGYKVTESLYGTIASANRTSFIVSSDPTDTLYIGRIIFNSTESKFKIFGYSGWVEYTGNFIPLRSRGTLAQCPNVKYHNNVMYIGMTYYATDLGITIYWDGTNWLYNGVPVDKIKGSTSAKPTMIQGEQIGFMYFDTTLNMPIYWTGTTWVDGNGETVGLQVSDTSVLIGAADNSTKNVYVYYSGTAPTITVLNSDDSANTWLTATYTLYAPTFVTNTYYSAANTKVATKPSNWETNYMDYFTDAEATIPVAGVPKNEVVLTADANNTSAPRGAKILVTLDDELVIINVVQSY